MFIYKMLTQFIAFFRQVMTDTLRKFLTNVIRVLEVRQLQYVDKDK